MLFNNLIRCPRCLLVLPQSAVLVLGLVSCEHGEAVRTPSEKSAAAQGISAQGAKKQDDTTEHWLIDATGSVKSEFGKEAHDLNDQEVTLLENEISEQEKAMKELILDLDENLDNPEARATIQEELKTKSVGYKQRTLLLAKEKLQNQR